MRKIFLPKLQKIQIENFTLYPEGLNFRYKFIDGVNLVIGGNGMGKTTFVNLIKYGIIGHYRKHYDFTRTYREKRIERRTVYSPDYFTSRQDASVLLDERPTITVEFELNKDRFVVKRSLDDISLLALHVNGSDIAGKVVTQMKYEQTREEGSKDLLFSKYEEKVAESAGISFDDLIFFVNEILFFGEDHRTILWSDDTPNVQEELFNKYFNEPDLDQARQDAARQAKYFDSMSRKKSEDMRAIKKVLRQVEGGEADDDGTSIQEQVLTLTESVEKLDRRIAATQAERIRVDDQIRTSSDRINKLTQLESDLEKNKKRAEYKKLGAKWRKLHKNYDAYFQSIKVNQICPLCSQDLDKDFVEEKIENLNSCYLCSQQLIKLEGRNVDKEFNALSQQLLDNYNEIQNAQKTITDLEAQIKLLDGEFRKLVIEKRKSQSKLRRLQNDSQQVDSVNGDLQAFYDEIEVLQNAKDEFQEKSRREMEKSREIAETIEQQITENTSRFSLLFANFAQRFLGVECSLTFDNFGSGSKRFFPVIAGTVRRSEEELSESQRFFVDHSFRMSILSFFYTKPTFYIVETPNSSLDISYEKNAAEVFATFLQMPHELIITTNLNNSEFLTHLIDYAKKVSYVNLLEIGKKSHIQQISRSMRTIANRVISKIDHAR